MRAVCGTSSSLQFSFQSGPALAPLRVVLKQTQQKQHLPSQGTTGPVKVPFCRHVAACSSIQAGRATAGPGLQLSPGINQAPANNAITRLYDAINRRDAAGIAAALAADVKYQNMALLDTFSGHTAVVQFYQGSLSALPEEAQLLMESCAGGSSTGPGSVAIVWRLVLRSNQVTISRGMSFFTINADGCISSIIECPEHPVKLSARGLSMFGPLVQTFTGTMLPAVQEVGRALQGGVDLFLQPLSSFLPELETPPESPVSSVLYNNTAVSSTGTPPSSNASIRSSSSRSWGTSHGSSLTPGSSVGSSSGGTSSGTRSGSGSWGARQVTLSAVNSSTGSSSAGASRSDNALQNRGRPVAQADSKSFALGPRAATRLSKSSAAAAAGSGAVRRVGPVAAAGVVAAAGISGADAAGRGLTAAAATGVASGSSAEAAAADQPDFSGLWVKVPERSDAEGYEAALDVLGLSGLQKMTARLIEGIEIQHTFSTFTVNFVTVVPFFKIIEEVPLDGGASQLSRRDLRWGRQKATASRVPGGVRIDMSWGPPMAGTLTEQYTLLQDGCLCVAAETKVGDKAASSSTVYQRAEGDRNALLSDSKKRNPSVAAVMQKQKEQGLSM